MFITVKISRGSYGFWEQIDVEKYLEEYDEDKLNDYPEHCQPHYFREIPPTEESKIYLLCNGNHFIYGYLESLFQSNISPKFILDYNCYNKNKHNPLIIEVINGRI